MHEQFILFRGTASSKLAAQTAQLLGQELGRCTIERFPDDEVNMHLDKPVRGREVFLIQTNAPPVDENLVELLAKTYATDETTGFKLGQLRGLWSVDFKRSDFAPSP